MATKILNLSYASIPGAADLFYFSYSASLSVVSKRMRHLLESRVESFLCTCWRTFPPGLNKILTKIEEESAAELESAKKRRYRSLFVGLEKSLSKMLTKLDAASAQRLRKHFSCSLSPARFVLMHERIVKLTCIDKVWPQIGKQIDTRRLIVTVLQKERFLSSDESASVSACAKIATLNLQQQNLSEFPSEFSRFKNLASLSISENHFTELPDCITHFTRLNELDLRKNPWNPNQHEKIVSKLIDLPNLQTVSVDCYTLEESIRRGFDERRAFVVAARALIQHDPHFAKLFTQHDNIHRASTLIKLFGEESTADLCANISDFSFHSSALKCIPERVFYCLRSVKKLNLSWNLFKSLPEGIFLLVNLEELNLRGIFFPRKKIEGIIRDLAKLPSLKTVHHNDPVFVEGFKKAKQKTNPQSATCVIL